MSQLSETYIDLMIDAIANQNAKKVVHYGEQVLPILLEDRIKNKEDITFVQDAVDSAKKIIELENKKENVVDNIIDSNSSSKKSSRIKLK
jgi:hypothetical protein